MSHDILRLEEESPDSRRSATDGETLIRRVLALELERCGFTDWRAAVMTMPTHDANPRARVTTTYLDKILTVMLTKEESSQYARDVIDWILACHPLQASCQPGVVTVWAGGASPAGEDDL